jgi:hypothetical protein
MLVRIARLLALFALVLMPLSMASTTASAQPAASAAAGHCDEHPQPKPADSPSNAKMHCTGCTALPAMEAPAPIAELRPEAPMRLRPVEFVDGIEPETATPPPRIS